MIALPDDITPSDVQQWLEGGVFYARRNAKEPWDLAELRAVEGEDIYVMFIKEEQEHRVRPSDLRCHWPACGAINMPGGFAVNVERLQRRQYRRTYNSRCVRTSMPDKWLSLRTMEPQITQVDYEGITFLDELFNPKYPPNTYEARRKVAAGEVFSVAITPYLVLAGDRVHYRGTFVGRLLENDFHAECDLAIAAHVGKIVGVTVICK